MGKLKKEQSLLSKQTNKQEIGKTKQQGNKNDWKQQTPSILTLYINVFNAPIKRHRIANWAKK
jgi:hypothetical protein